MMVFPMEWGFCKTAFEAADKLKERTLNVIKEYSCVNGCPACVHSTKCGSGNRPIDKASSLKIFEMIDKGISDETSYDIKSGMKIRLKKF
jgi:DEAD/DEAH box helicase domain-containing protein